MPAVPDAEIVFLFIGGSHQVYHLAPVAAELARLLPERRVVCLSSDPATTREILSVREGLDAPGLRVETVSVPLWGRCLAALRRRRSALKQPLLFGLRHRLARAAAVITPERTSGKLRRMGLRDVPMIHFRHGGGDRATASDDRFRAFDLVVVAGEKHVRHAIETIGLPPARVRAAGYVKLDYLTRAGRDIAPPFAGARPVVLYNPHFDPALSSLPVAAEVVAAFARQDRYDLIVAPHIRAAENMAAGERARWQALAAPGRIVVDLDSPALVDMTHILAADVYLGDVSSQVYEFLARPRPVAFLNHHRVAWAGDPRYAGWELGEVCETADGAVAAVDRAVAGHAARVEAQRRAVAWAFGEIGGAARRGAEIVAEAISQTRK